MMTNLIATITISLFTNVVTHVPQHMIAEMHLQDGAIIKDLEDDPNPTNKEVVTQIFKETEISFNYMGRSQAVFDNESISIETNCFTLGREWIAVTNLPVTAGTLTGVGIILRDAALFWFGLCVGIGLFLYLFVIRNFVHEFFNWMRKRKWKLWPGWVADLILWGILGSAILIALFVLRK
jgi:hypothetical protein